MPKRTTYYDRVEGSARKQLMFNHPKQILCPTKNRIYKVKKCNKSKKNVTSFTTQFLLRSSFLLLQHLQYQPFRLQSKMPF